MKLQIHKWGNSAAIRLNQPLLRQLDVGVGSLLVADVCDGGLVLRPVTEPQYSLEALLTTCTRARMRLEEEDREWLDDASVGKEA